MAERGAPIALVYEGMAARYRALMMNARDPARRRMLEEMIAREMETIRRRADRAAWGFQADIGNGPAVMPAAVAGRRIESFLLLRRGSEPPGIKRSLLTQGRFLFGLDGSGFSPMLGASHKGQRT